MHRDICIDRLSIPFLAYTLKLRTQNTFIPIDVNNCIVFFLDMFITFVTQSLFRCILLIASHLFTHRVHNFIVGQQFIS